MRKIRHPTTPLSFIGRIMIFAKIVWQCTSWETVRRKRNDTPRLPQKGFNGRSGLVAAESKKYQRFLATAHTLTVQIPVFLFESILSGFSARVYLSSMLDTVSILSRGNKPQFSFPYAFG